MKLRPGQNKTLNSAIIKYRNKHNMDFGAFIYHALTSQGYLKNDLKALLSLPDKILRTAMERFMREKVAPVKLAKTKQGNKLPTITDIVLSYQRAGLSILASVKMHNALSGGTLDMPPALEGQTLSQTRRLVASFEHLFR